MPTTLRGVVSCCSTSRVGHLNGVVCLVQTFNGLQTLKGRCNRTDRSAHRVDAIDVMAAICGCMGIEQDAIQERIEDGTAGVLDAGDRHRFRLTRVIGVSDHHMGERAEWQEWATAAGWPACR